MALSVGAIIKLKYDKVNNIKRSINRFRRVVTMST